MSQLLPTDRFKWVSIEPNEVSDLTKHDKGYLLEADVSYPRDLHDPHKDLPFMCKRMKTNGTENLVPNLYDKKNYIIHIQALNYEVILEKIHQVIEFDQSVCMDETLH